MYRFNLGLTSVCFFKLGGDVGATAAAPISQTTTGLLGDIFGFSAAPSMYTAPKVNWLPAEKGKGLDVWGTFSRKYVFGLRPFNLKLNAPRRQLICTDLCLFLGAVKYQWTLHLRTRQCSQWVASLCS